MEVVVTAHPPACLLLLASRQEFKGYVFKIMGGQDKQGFPMKQGVLTNGRVQVRITACACTVPCAASLLPCCAALLPCWLRGAGQ